MIVSRKPLTPSSHTSACIAGVLEVAEGASVVIQGNKVVGQEHHHHYHIASLVQAAPHATPDNPFAECPHYGLPYFVREKHVVRKGLMEVLRESMSTSEQTVLTACHGLGGVGKTQLARYFCDALQQQTPPPYQFIGWVNGDTQEQVKQNFITLGQGLGLVPFDIPPEVSLPRIKRFFESRSDWLLVFDNIQEPAWLADFLPQGGHVLITTRNEHWATGTLIPVDVMSETESIELLKRLSGYHDTDFSEVARVLGCLALALAQAASYMKAAPLISTGSGYLAAYARKQEALLEYDRLPLGHAHKPVTVTWLMNVEKVKERSADAVRLLRAIGYLHREAIPWSVLIRLLDESGLITDESSDRMNDALMCLAEYSLINLDAGNRSLSVHVLVQTIVRWYEWGDGQISTTINWQQVVDAVIVDVDEDNEAMEAFMHRQVLLPHLKALLAYGQRTEKQAELIHGVFSLLSILRKIYFDLQDGPESIVACTALIEMISEIQGGGSTDYATALSHLGRAYGYLGDYPKAKEVHERALAIQRNLKEVDDSEVARILNNLGNTHLSLGNYQEAKKYHDDALVIQMSAYGDEHIEVARILDDLGNTSMRLEDYSEAKECYERALRIKRGVYENEHIEMARTLSALGSTHRWLGNLIQAKECHEHALTIEISAYGDEHVKTAGTLHNLANVYVKLLNFDQARECYQRVLVIGIRTYGDRHINISVTLNNLGVIYGYLNNYVEAKEYLERALAIKIKAYGDDHVRVASTLAELGIVHVGLKNYDEAREHLERSLAIKIKAYGEEHIRVARAWVGFYKMDVGLGNVAQAIGCCKRVLALQIKAYGERHLEVAVTQLDLALFYAEEQYFLDAQSMIDAALQTFLNFEDFGKDHPYTQKAMQEKARIDEKVVLLQEPAMSIGEAGRIEVYEDGLSLLQYHQRLALVYRDRLFDYPQALLHFNEALNLVSRFPNTYNHQQSIQQSIRDIHRKQALDDVLQVGIASFKSDDYDQALGQFQQALVDGESIETMNVSETMNNLHYNVGSCYLKLGDHNSAQAWLQRCYAWRLEHLDEEHEKTQEVKIKLDALSVSASDLENRFC